MQHTRWLTETPDLRDPIVILAFEGWNDAGDAASTAAAHIADRFDADVFAETDSEDFFDFSSSRPIVRLNGGEREIEWPATRFYSAKLPNHPNDLVIVIGDEPQLRWRSFASEIVSTIMGLKPSLVISLGALIAEVAHSRPITVFGSSADSDLRERLDLEPSTYEGPTGIVGIIHHKFAESEIKTISLWGSLPNYVPHAPSPKAALALVERVAELTSLKIPSGALEVGAKAYESQIDRLVADDIDMASYVETLEREYDAAMDPQSTGEMINDLEEFLRKQK